MAWEWRSQENLGESVFIFYPVDLRDETKVIQLDGKHLYLWNHVTKPHEW